MTFTEKSMLAAQALDRLRERGLESVSTGRLEQLIEQGQVVLEAPPEIPGIRDLLALFRAELVRRKMS